MFFNMEKNVFLNAKAVMRTRMVITMVKWIFICAHKTHEERLRHELECMIVLHHTMTWW